MRMETQQERIEAAYREWERTRPSGPEYQPTEREVTFEAFEAGFLAGWVASRKKPPRVPRSEIDT